jgi:fructose/tagatose bisphosphate aldolase
MLVSLRQLMDHGAEHNYGYPAFNVSNIEQIHAVMKAAKKVGSPAVLQFSKSARKYATDNFIKNSYIFPLHYIFGYIIITKGDIMEDITILLKLV